MRPRVGPTTFLAAITSLVAACEGDAATWRFTEVGAAGGVAWRHQPRLLGAFDAYDHGNGLAAGDFDGDGHDDLLLLTQCGPTGYFLGNGDGSFRDRSDLLAGLEDGVRVAATFGDYDLDGDVDLYVTFVRRPNALLRQNDDGSFTDVAAGAGVDASGHFSGAAFGDFDRDGDLDLLVAGNMPFTNDTLTMTEGCPPTYFGIPTRAVFARSRSEPSRLFVNQGAASGFAFVDEAAARGVPVGAEGAPLGFGGLTVGDLDRDGDLDALFCEMFAGRSTLVTNDGAGRFTAVTPERMPQPSYGSAGAAIDDFDGDGWPDVYMVDMHSDMNTYPATDYSGVDPELRFTGDRAGFPPGDNPTGPIYGNTLWLQTRHDGGPMTEAALPWHAETFQPWGAHAADFDNDGRLDVFVTTGMANPFPYWPNALLMNTGTRFVHGEVEHGLEPFPQGRTDPSVRTDDGLPLVVSTRGAATADFDEDGALDLVVLSWNGRALVFRNDLPAERHWLDVQLVGRTGAEPYGAEVEVVAGGRSIVRQLHTASGYLSQSAARVHVGLGTASQVERVRVLWPDGTRTDVEAPAVDARLTIRQPPA